MNRLLFFLLLFPSFVVAQKFGKQQKKQVNHIKKHIFYLSDDQLEGRRAGSAGEKLAAEYVATQFKAANLTPKGTNAFFQDFNIDEGRQIAKASHFRVDGKDLSPGTEFYPLGFSPDSKTIEAASAIAISESGNPWFINVTDGILANKDNPHFDIQPWLKDQTINAAQKGATAVIFYSADPQQQDLLYNGKDKSDKSPIPALYISSKAWQKYFSDPSGTYDFSFRLETEPKIRTCRNVVGFLDNQAPTTVVIGAHLDHLGYGEDGNSMSRPPSPAIHNGADDNASGTTGLIVLAQQAKQWKNSKHNFLFIAFSGEELGLYGSKYFVEHPTVDIQSISYMINMDMIGRMNDSTQTITIGGYGTSPAWSQIIKSGSNPQFSIRLDSSGTGPSDHTSFYRKDIPVLFFFTGLHTDYHKPSDDAPLINLSGLEKVTRYIQYIIQHPATRGKLQFLKTREQQTGTSTRFSVSMGIMPDYTFSGNGVRVEGVSEGRAAQKAGVKTGDILIKLGSTPVNSVESYMQALSKFKKGDKTSATFRRGDNEVTIDIQF